MLVAAIVFTLPLISQPYTLSLEVGAGNFNIDNHRSNLNKSDIRPGNRFPDPGLVIGASLHFEPRDKWLLGLRGHGQFHPSRYANGVDIGLSQYQATVRLGYVMYRQNKLSLAPFIGVGGSVVSMPLYNDRNNSASYGNSNIPSGDIRRYRISWLVPEVGVNALYWPKGTGIGPGIGFDLGIMGTTQRSTWIDARTGHPVGGVSRGGYQSAWFTVCFAWRMSS